MIINKIYKKKKHKRTRCSKKDLHSRKQLMRQSKEIKENWKGPKNFKIGFCVIFGSYDQNFISGGETGHEAVSTQV